MTAGLLEEVLGGDKCDKGFLEANTDIGAGLLNHDDFQIHFLKTKFFFKLTIEDSFSKKSIYYLYPGILF